MMKKLALLTMMIITMITTAQAASKTTTVEVNGGGEIRHGGLFSKDVTFSSFREEFKKQLSEKMEVQFEEGNVDFIVDIETTLNRGSFYSLFPHGLYEAEVTNLTTGRHYFVGFKCAFEVNDGGNVTLKKRCAAKLAKKVNRLIKRQ